jgi:hypothetical protein
MTLDGEVGEWMNGSGEAKNEDSGTRRGLGYEGKGMECGRKDLEARESRWRGRVKTAILKSTNGSRTNGQSLESGVQGGLVVMVEGFVTLILRGASRASGIGGAKGIPEIIESASIGVRNISRSGSRVTIDASKVKADLLST